MCESRNTAPSVANVANTPKDWTDSKQDPKKRGKILSNGVVLKLMKKSNWEGCKRFFSNMVFMLLTAHTIHLLGIFSSIREANDLDHLRSALFSDKTLVFIPLYAFYGFQMQCMGFAGGHELLHGNAFKSRWLNTLVTFFVSTVFFEILWHERLNHKQHHIYTLCIDNDPELTSFYSRKELEALKFRSVPKSRYTYTKQFLNVLSYFEHRIFRLLSSCAGIATDYTGLGWSMKSPKREELNPSIIRELQVWSLFQLGAYIAIFSTFGTTVKDLQFLIFYWIAPCIIGYGPINYFRNAEHADCDLRHVTPNQLHNTRTVESNRFVRWLLWETNFHAEHHAYPMVPFYNLPALHKLLDAHIKHNECKTFTAQNWNMVMEGGWIDKQDYSDSEKFY
jgi:fatty acid desaturase